MLFQYAAHGFVAPVVLGVPRRFALPAGYCQQRGGIAELAVQAGAARAVIDKDPDAAKGMLAGVETSAREAISDLRQLLETLRSPGDTDHDEAPSTLGLDALPTLVDASRAAGLPTTLQVIGERMPVPDVVGVNLYRIAQEALTNARRHAGAGATADVRLRYEAGSPEVTGSVELEVTNTGRAVTAARPGLGQLGMRERTAASGGEIEIGPRERGGFRVRVRVPVAMGVPA